MKLKKNDKQQRPEPVPGWVRVLEGYLKAYMPAGRGEEGAVLRTSADIAGELDDMADVSIDQISDVMARLGYIVQYIPGGGHGWLLRPVPFSDPREKFISVDRE